MVAKAPLRLLHLSDTHIGANWLGVDAAPLLEATVNAACALRCRPDAILVSGDIADHGDPEEYRFAYEQISRIGGGILALPGNHDDRGSLRTAFPTDHVAGSSCEQIRYAVRVSGWNLILLDTTITGQVAGDIDAAQLDWLRSELGKARQLPTVIAMHHPPFSTGDARWDSFGLPAATRDSFAEIVADHPQIQRILAGHVHRVMGTQVGGRGALAVPGTYGQAEIELADDCRMRFSRDGSPMFALHIATDGQLISHLQSVAF